MEQVIRWMAWGVSRTREKNCNSGKRDVIINQLCKSGKIGVIIDPPGIWKGEASFLILSGTNKTPEILESKSLEDLECKTLEALENNPPETLESETHAEDSERQDPRDSGE